MENKKIIQEFQELLDSNITNTMIKFSKLNRGYLSKLEISAGIIAQQWIKDNKKMSEDFFLKALEKQKSDLVKEIQRRKSVITQILRKGTSEKLSNEEGIGYLQALEEVLGILNKK